MSNLEEFLAATHSDANAAATALALKRAVRKPSDAVAAAVLLASAKTLDLSGDPFFKRGPGLDARLIAQHVPWVTELRLSQGDVIHAEALANLVSLRSLEMTNTKLTDVSWMGALTALETLRIGENPLGDAILLSQENGPLAALPWTTLRCVEISGLGLRSLAFIPAGTPLEEFDASKNSLASLAPLRSLSTLRKLKLAHNLVDDLAPLSGFRKLRTLDFDGNAVGDLTPLEYVSSLSEISFRNNRVRSLKPLRSLRDLMRVACSGNPLHDDDFDAIPRSVRVD